VESGLALRAVSRVFAADRLEAPEWLSAPVTKAAVRVADVETAGASQRSHPAATSAAAPRVPAGTRPAMRAENGGFEPTRAFRSAIGSVHLEKPSAGPAAARTFLSGVDQATSAKPSENTRFATMNPCARNRVGARSRRDTATPGASKTRNHRAPSADVDRDV
jgi:hypothetical protein